MRYALVKSPIAPLYLRPEVPCELADEALCGWRVEITEELPGGWCKVKTHYSYTSYLHQRHLELAEDRPGWWEALPNQVVTRPPADILNAPKVQGACVETLPRGAWVSPAGPADENGWVPVTLCDGRTGYTKHSFLGEVITAWDPADEAQLRERLVRTALSYMGVQYRWGGRTPLGIDCSGLCSQAYLMNGILIHRDARIDPAFSMKPIPRARLDRAGWDPMDRVQLWLTKADAPTDGLVSPDSAVWGVHRGTMEGVSHQDSAGGRRRTRPGFDAGTFYIRLVQELAEMGF